MSQGPSPAVPFLLVAALGLFIWGPKLREAPIDNVKEMVVTTLSPIVALMVRLLLLIVFFGKHDQKSWTRSLAYRTSLSSSSSSYGAAGAGDHGEEEEGFGLGMFLLVMLFLVLGFFLFEGDGSGWISLILVTPFIFFFSMD